MPLTLSVINTLIVKIDSIFYAIPELNIEYIVRINKNNTYARLEKVNKSLVLIYNGRIIPVITMNEIEAKAKGSLVSGASASYTSASSAGAVSADTVLERCRAANVTKCLVLRSDEKSFALLIDEAVKTEQTLVKPLPVYLQNCPCYLSVTVLGNGKAVTILDAAGIIRFMGIEDIEKEAVKHQQLEASPQGPANKTSEEEEGKGREKQVIIFKCSGKEFYAVETRDILRIESIRARDIQEINNGLYINISGVTWRIVRPEDFVPSVKKDYSEEKLYVLTLKNSASSTGLLVKNVIDKAEGEFTLDRKQLQSDFILGTGVFNEKILIFLNSEEIAGHVEKERAGRKNVKKEKII